MSPSALCPQRELRHLTKPGAQGMLRDILTGVPSQDFIDKRLIPDTAPPCFLAELIEHSRVDSDRDQLAGLVAKGRTTDAPHGLQLLRG